MFFINACSDPDKNDQAKDTLPDNQIGSKIYCEKLKYEELKLAEQAEDIRDKILANPLKREPRLHLFEQHHQIITQLRSVQVSMSTQCSLAP